MTERFIRNEMLLGPRAMEKLKSSHVCVVGHGGGGGGAAEARAPAGVGGRSQVDRGAYSLSNINRQLGALTSTAGRSKAAVMAERVRDINPDCAVHPLAIHYDRETPDSFFDGLDYIADAIDLVSCKIDLICRARDRGIPVLSALGTGNKLDPSRLEVTDLSLTRGCPLARVMRRELGRRDIRHLKVVYSSEEAVPCAPLEAPPPGRRSVPGSVPWVPPIAGIMMAGAIVMDLVGEARPYAQD